MSTKKAKQGKTKKPLVIESKHAGSIIQVDKNGNTWLDSTTLCLELQISPFTWSGLYLEQVERHYGDRNMFRRVHGRQALWNFDMVRAWYLQRKSPKAGYEARYLAKLREKGELVA